MSSKLEALFRDISGVMCRVIGTISGSSMLEAACRLQKDTHQVEISSQLLFPTKPRQMGLIFVVARILARWLSLAIPGSSHCGEPLHRIVVVAATERHDVLEEYRKACEEDIVLGRPEIRDANGNANDASPWREVSSCLCRSAEKLWWRWGS